MIKATYIDKSNTKHYRSYNNHSYTEVLAISRSYNSKIGWRCVSVIKEY